MVGNNIGQILNFFILVMKVVRWKSELSVSGTPG